MKFSRSKFRALSSLFGNISIVALASIVVPAFGAVDKVNLLIVLLELIAFTSAAWISLWAAEKGKL